MSGDIKKKEKKNKENESEAWPVSGAKCSDTALPSDSVNQST